MNSTLLKTLPVFIYLFCFADVMGQPLATPTTPKDEFSKAFLYVYKEAPAYFMSLRGREIKVGNYTTYSCKKYMPGSRTAYITAEERSDCCFEFGPFETAEEAGFYMLNLSNKVSTAFCQRAMIKYIDSTTGDLLKRTAIAEVKEGGFSGYNVLIDVVRKKPELGNYVARLTILGGEGIFYKMVRKGEPMRSPFFAQTFAKMLTQFNDMPAFACGEALPGFTCEAADSAGKGQLQMVKYLADRPDAIQEFEILSTSIRCMLGDGYLYYFPPCSSGELKHIVFIRYIDHDLDLRKSISATLTDEAPKGYAMRVMMFHP